MDMKGAGKILEGTLEKERGAGWEYNGVGGPVAMLTDLIPPLGTL